MSPVVRMPLAWLFCHHGPVRAQISGVAVALGLLSLVACDSPEGHSSDFHPASATEPTGRVAAELGPQARVDNTAAFPSPVPGLRLLGEIEDEDGHFVELSITDGVVRVANYASGISSYRIHEDGDLEIVQPHTFGVFCTSITQHAPSGRVLCTVVDGESDITQTLIADDSTLSSAPAIPHRLREVFDILVQGDSVLLAAGSEGLYRMDVDAGWPFDKTLLLEGEVVRVAASSSGRIAALDRLGGLVVLDRDGTELASRDHVGPELDLAFFEDRVAIAAGSEGVVVYDIADDALIERARLHPRCVATAVDLRDELLAIGCFTGVYLYDLTEALPELVGFHPARTGIVDVSFSASGLVVADWTRLAHYGVEPAGEVLYVDVPAVRRVSERTPLLWRAFNASDEDQTVDLEFEGNVLRHDVRVPAGGHAEQLIERAEFGDFGIVGFLDAISDQARWAARAGNLSPRRVGSRTAVVLQDDASLVTPNARPMRGELFPGLRLADRAGEPVDVAPAGRARYVFYLTSCPLLWPQLEDLAWRVRGPGMPELILVATEDIDEYFIRRLRLGDLVHYVQGQGGIETPEGGWYELGDQLFYRGLLVGETPRGLSSPTDYVVDDEGVVQTMERLYRGPFPL